MTTPIAASDQTWLHMDRPNNLMHVHSLMWFDNEPAWEDLVAILQERMVDRFPVFSQRPAQHGRSWVWEDDPDFDLSRHLRRREVPAETGVEDLRLTLSQRFSELFEEGRPLWDMEVIPGVHGLAEGPVTVLFMRFHHALADGIRLVQLMLSLCDLSEQETGTVLPADVGRRGGGRRLAVGVGTVGRRTADFVDLARGATVGAASAAWHMPETIWSRLRPSRWERDLAALVDPSRLVDVVQGLSSETNESVNTVSEVTRMLTAGPERGTVWNGTPGVAKGIAWVNGLDIRGVKQVGRAHDATVNDVLLAIISRALTHYLREREAPVGEIHWMVPVSLKPLDRNLPTTLGNHFALVYLAMPLGIDDTAELLEAVRSRMARLKNSAEPVVAFGLQWAIAETSQAIATRITNLFANKAVGVLTNVPGPRQTMSFAGVRVLGTLGWAPTSGDEPMSLSIFSYAGQVHVGVAADAGLIPDPERIAELIQESYDAIVTGPVETAVAARA